MFLSLAVTFLQSEADNITNRTGSLMTRFTENAHLGQITLSTHYKSNCLDMLHTCTSLYPYALLKYANYSSSLLSPLQALRVAASISHLSYWHCDPPGYILRIDPVHKRLRERNLSLYNIRYILKRKSI